jgi:hypothetical protein
MVVVPTTQAPIPKLAAVVSYKSPDDFGPGIFPHRPGKIFPSIVVTM